MAKPSDTRATSPDVAEWQPPPAASQPTQYRTVAIAPTSWNPTRRYRARAGVL